MAVFVLDKRKRPLMPCSEKRARLLLERGRARVHRRYPFTIRLIDRTVEDSVLQPVEIKLDPGSKTTGLAVVRKGSPAEGGQGKSNKPDAVLWLAELAHRGRQISEALTARRGFRRRRRNANLRYRPARFDNRTKPEGWLAPSLRHRVETTMSWVSRLQRWCPITSLATELVRFDMQAIERPEISGVEYSQGDLAGYEVREFVLERDGRCCAYCGAKDVPLNLDHVVPRSRGGSNRASNLVLSCVPCNERKGAQPVEAFLAKKPSVLAKIKATLRRPLKDAAAVNATRWALLGALKATGLPVSAWSGGRTKWNRSRLGIPKTHALDATCVGEVEALTGWRVPMLAIKAMGRGSYSRTRTDSYGFPRLRLTRQKRHFGFQTGDIVRAVVPSGKNAGTHTGRVAVAARGTFSIRTTKGLVKDVSWKHCAAISGGDGYSFALRANSNSPPT